jgi:hypothetical protein
MLAKFALNSTGADNARVAAFDVEFVIESGGSYTKIMNVPVQPGENADTTITLKNNSEVAVAYTITINRLTTSNLPSLQFTKLSEQSENATEISGTESDNAWVFNLQDQPQSGNSIKKYTLHTSWKTNTSTAEKDTNLDYIGMVDGITVTVNATQID